MLALDIILIIIIITTLKVFMLTNQVLQLHNCREFSHLPPKVFYIIYANTGGKISLAFIN